MKLIAFINGTLSGIFENYVVLENNGIGYQIYTSTGTAGRLPGTGSAVKLFTNLYVKEDALSLYGFLTTEELEMFNKLILVSGIGPKVALGILSAMTPSQLMLAIVTDDVATLSKAPGVGKKTAQRLSLELKDKIKTADAVYSTITDSQQSLGLVQSEKNDAIEALISLGYSRGEAVKAVMEVAVEGLTTDRIIKLALKKLSAG